MADPWMPTLLYVAFVFTIVLICLVSVLRRMKQIDKQAMSALKITRQIAEVAERADGNQAHRILPHLWPLVCDAHRLHKGEGS
jgi:Na+-transporting methylmalonyl-CoA/oxaloacetate decarboxylase gamma subunit